jgi:hypothetical protein
MLEVFAHEDHIAKWNEAIATGSTDWQALFDGYVAAVDWPVVAFWRELADAYPDATILFSVRDSESWWKSCDRTILEIFRRDPVPGTEAWLGMATSLLERRFTERFLNRDDAVAAYEQHSADVRRSADPKRLVEWHPGDGWEPICAALSVPVPDEPFPHANTTEEFRKMGGWD